MKKKFTREFMVGILYDFEDKIVKDEITDHSRWSVHHSLIFEHEGKLWETYYSTGATESQDERPWEHEDEVECDEVEAYEKTITEYRAVK